MCDKHRRLREHVPIRALCLHPCGIRAYNHVAQNVGMKARSLSFIHRERQNVCSLVDISVDSVQLSNLFIVGDENRELALPQLKLLEHRTRAAEHLGAPQPSVWAMVESKSYGHLLGRLWSHQDCHLSCGNRPSIREDLHGARRIPMRASC